MCNQSKLTSGWVTYGNDLAGKVKGELKFWFETLGLSTSLCVSGVLNKVSWQSVWAQKSAHISATRLRNYSTTHFISFRKLMWLNCITGEVFRAFYCVFCYHCISDNLLFIVKLSGHGDWGAVIAYLAFRDAFILTSYTPSALTTSQLARRTNISSRKMGFKNREGLENKVNIVPF